MKKRDRTITILYTKKEMKKILKAAKAEDVVPAELVYRKTMEALKKREIGFKT